MVFISNHAAILTSGMWVLTVIFIPIFFIINGEDLFIYLPVGHSYNSCGEKSIRDGFFFYFQIMLFVPVIELHERPL